jgi:hypothetical protein
LFALAVGAPPLRLDHCRRLRCRRAAQRWHACADPDEGRARASERYGLDHLNQSGSGRRPLPDPFVTRAGLSSPSCPGGKSTGVTPNPITHIAPSILSSFVTPFVAIGPVETAVVFAGLTSEVHRSQRRRLALRSITIAGLVLLVFAIAGSGVLSLLHISLSAFASPEDCCSSSRP